MNEQRPYVLLEDLMKVMQSTIAQRHASFVELNRTAEKGGIVFAGDSITEQFNIHELLKSDKPMYNRGIGGETTDGVLEKLNDVVLDLEPSKVFLLIGTNDLGNGKKPDEVAGNIEVICSRIRGALPRTQLHVLSIYPVNRSVQTKNFGTASVVGLRSNEDIRDINLMVREFAVANECYYIDLYSRLVDEEGDLKADYTYDGLHLNVKGYKVVSQEIQPYV
jgi:lysophospholipase L1-like esterase